MTALAACTNPSTLPKNELRILLAEKTKNLNPRQTVDATGQRVGALLFRALTRIDADLAPQPDLAERWEVTEGGKLWRFKIRPDAKDQSGESITAERLAACLEQYRVGKPTSPHASAFPNWQSSEAHAGWIRLNLSRPDPYFTRNISLLRYFREKNAAIPCAEPTSGADIVGSGEFRMEHWDLAPDGDITLIGADQRRVKLIFIRDDTTLALRLLRGDVHLTQSSLSLPKTNWFKKAHGDQFVIRERDGVNVSYLLFNLREPILAKAEVRQAIAHALNRDEIVKTRLHGYCTRADSFLLPLLPEGHSTPLAYDPVLSEKLLDQAGWPRANGHGMRFKLTFKTSPYRDSIETALIFQDQLRKVGIELQIEAIEPSTLLNSLRKGHFQLSQSRWVGIADGSILNRTLHSGQKNNRAGYSSPEVDRWLDQAMSEINDVKRAALLAKVQTRMMEDLPYFPLWFWNNTVIARKAMTPQIEKMKISLSGGLEPLVSLKPE